MIIDFHTHAFSDAVADKAFRSLVRNSGGAYKPVRDLTRGSLIDYMDKHGIDKSVVLNVVTKPSQTEVINRWAKDNDDGRTVMFGGVHPDSPDWKKEIDAIAASGLKGMKFHAEYQNFVLDEDRMLRIYDYALGKGLIIVHHAGFDPIGSEPFKTSPKRFARVLDLLGGGKIVAAHFGGQSQWDEVAEYLAGRDVYFDTSMGFAYYGEETFLKIAAIHGYDRILFGSDNPWSDAAQEIERIKSLPISDENKSAVLGLNAARLLGLREY